MTLIVELLLLFFVVFFAARLATTGHVDSHKAADQPPDKLVYVQSQLNS